MSFIPGDDVRIIGGPFATMLGSVVSSAEALVHPQRSAGWSANDRLVWVILSIYGRDVPVPFEPDEIEHR